MRTIIISDITETSDSIIPYGLNVGKHTETRVDILHYFDPRLIHGKYSSISDSQSISPGEKLSHGEILHREKEITRAQIEKLLSKEASRLNYPLRVNTITEIEDIETAISLQLKKYDNPIVITGTTPGSSMTANLQDLLNLIIKADGRILIIPPGKKFEKPEKCCLITDLTSETNKKIQKLFSWLSPISTKVYTSAVVNTDFKSFGDQRMEEWKRALAPYNDKIKSDTTEVFYFNEIALAFEIICEQKNPDMMVMPYNKNTELSKYLFAYNNLKKLVEQIRIPVLIY
jgi:hypothetical protein